MFLAWLLCHRVTFAEGRTLKRCPAKAVLKGTLSTGMPRCTALHFIVPRRCCMFYKLKATLQLQKDVSSLYCEEPDARYLRGTCVTVRPSF